MWAKSKDLLMQHIFNGKSIVTKGLIKNEDYNRRSALLHITKRRIVSWIFGLAKIHYEIQQVRQFMQIFHDSNENLWLNSKIGLGIKFKLMLLCQEIATELASKKSSFGLSSETKEPIFISIHCRHTEKSKA